MGGPEISPALGTVIGLRGVLAALLLVSPLVLHEAAHWAALRSFGYEVKAVEIGIGPTIARVKRFAIRLLPVSGCVVPDQDLEAMPWTHRFIVAMAGPAASALYSALLLSGTLTLPHHNTGLTLLGMFSLFMAIFNLLPVPGLDGWVALRAMMQGVGWPVPRADQVMGAQWMAGTLLLATGCFWLFSNFMFPAAFAAG